MVKTLSKCLILILSLFILAKYFVLNAFAISLPDYKYTYITSASNGGSNVVTTATTSDENGNIYMTGYFEGTADFDPTSGIDEKTSTYKDAFLTKINEDGTYAYTYIFSGGDDGWAYDVTTDNDGNVYVVGSFYFDIDFDPSGSTDERIATFEDSFLVIINADGTYDNTYTWGGDAGTTVRPTSIVVDSEKNIYLGGYFYETVDFDPGIGTQNRTSNGAMDFFLLKLNADRNFNYIYTVGGDNEDLITDMVIDSDDNIYYSGYYRDNTVDLDPTSGTESHTAPSVTNSFITKINSNGSYGYSYVIDSIWDNEAYALTIDRNNNIYFGGSFSNTIDFNTQSGDDEHSVVDLSGVDAYLTKLNSNGNYQYTYTWGGIYDDFVLSMDTDAQNNIYSVGKTISETIDFDPTSGIDNKSTAQSGKNSLFLTRINSDQTYGYSGLFTGINSSDNFSIGEGDVAMRHNMVIDEGNNMYISGKVSGYVNFDPFGSDEIVLDEPTVFSSFLTKLNIPLDSNNVGDYGNDEAEDKDNKKEKKKCEDREPSLTSWIKLKPTTMNGVRGVLATWTQYGANKVVIKIDDGTNTFPWRTEKTLNDGHEFLPNVGPSQKIAIRPYNNCKEGDLSEAVSYNLFPRGWFNLSLSK